MSTWETVSARTVFLAEASVEKAARTCALVRELPAPRHVVFYNPDTARLHVGLSKTASDAVAAQWAASGLPPHPIDERPQGWGIAPWVLIKRSVAPLDPSPTLDAVGPWATNPLFTAPDALAAALAGGLLASGFGAPPPVPFSKLGFSIPDGAPMGSGIDDLAFLPAIDHHSFTRDVWNDQNTPLPIRAAAVGLLNTAQYASGGRQFISPYNVAQVSDDFHRGLLVGRSLGALASVGPAARTDLQSQGIWANLLTRLVPQALPDAGRLF